MQCTPFLSVFPCLPASCCVGRYQTPTKRQAAPMKGPLATMRGAYWAPASATHAQQTRPPAVMAQLGRGRGAAGWQGLERGFHGFRRALVEAGDEVAELVAEARADGGRGRGAVRLLVRDVLSELRHQLVPTRLQQDHQVCAAPPISE